MYYVENFKNTFKEIINKGIKNDDFKSENILISSKFGQGKTTLKNEIMKDEYFLNNFLIIDVDIWSNNNMNIDEIIFIEIIKHVSKNREKEFKKIMKESGKWILNITSKIFQIDFLINELDKTIKNIKNDEIKVVNEIIEQKYITTKTLRRYLNDIISKLGNEKIIFLFDELDRCSTEFIRKFFSSIKQMLNSNQIINIVFANTDFLNSIFKNESLDDEKYIDKFFNHIYVINSSTFDYLFNNLFPEFCRELNIKNKNILEANTPNVDFPTLTYILNQKVSFRDINKNIEWLKKVIIFVDKYICKKMIHQIYNEEEREMVKFIEKKND